MPSGGPVDAGPDTSEEFVATGVATVLRQLATDGPLLFVLDDADRVDASTAVLLGHLVDRLPAGVLVVVAFRDPPGGRHPPLLGLLGPVAVRASAERIVLGPLTEADLAELVRDRAGTADHPDVLAHHLWERTGGNPFYAVELAQVTGELGRGGSLPVPAGVRDVLRHRLTDLTEQARDILPVAALLGAEVDVELLAQVCNATQDEVTPALDEGVTAGLLVESGDSWRGELHLPPRCGAGRAALRGRRGAARAACTSPRPRPCRRGSDPFGATRPPSPDTSTAPAAPPTPR